MKKTTIVCVILILVGLAGTLAFLSLGRAGGEIGFDATHAKYGAVPGACCRRYSAN